MATTRTEATHGPTSSMTPVRDVTVKGPEQVEDSQAFRLEVTSLEQQRCNREGSLVYSLLHISFNMLSHIMNPLPMYTCCNYRYHEAMFWSARDGILNYSMRATCSGSPHDSIVPRPRQPHNDSICLVLCKAVH